MKYFNQIFIHQFSPTGTTYDGFPLGTFCGPTAPAPFGSAFTQNFVQFVSDPYTTDRGFNVTYQFTGV